MNDDEDLFKQEMAGVKPLAQKDGRVQLKKKDKTDKQLNRQAAVSEKVNDPNYLATEYVTMLDPFYVSSFKRPGIQEGVFKKLRLGKYPSEARLDLHRKKMEEARLEVFRFIQDVIKADLRNVTIIHGKGLHDSDLNLKNQSARSQGDKKAVLKSYVHHWLEQIPEVQGFHSAQPFDGGTGAVYVLIKKSEQARLRNKDKHQNKQR